MCWSLCKRKQFSSPYLRAQLHHSTTTSIFPSLSCPSCGCMMQTCFYSVATCFFFTSFLPESDLVHDAISQKMKSSMKNEITIMIPSHSAVGGWLVQRRRMILLQWGRDSVEICFCIRIYSSSHPQHPKAYNLDQEHQHHLALHHWEDLDHQPSVALRQYISYWYEYFIPYLQLC